ncbi:MAG: msrA [Bacillales bacterium]|jgi:peptide-methionine (S)-S-oxide reductase|nr:msrA [Bacillales bacterium]
MIATFGGGCFWEVEEAFRPLEGVKETTVGYMGGKVENPKYEEVYTDETGHAEVVQIDFDPEKITYEQLLEKFFEMHDPTQLNRQGEDVGTRYRTVVFFHDEDQKAAAEKMIAELEASNTFDKPIVTNVVPAVKFWTGEEYHQKYLFKRGLNSCSLL